MRILLFFLLFGAAAAEAQVFMRPFDNAAAMGLGGATVALPQLQAGLSNDAQLANSNKIGLFLGSAIPYGLGDWRTAQLQALVKIDKNSGAGLDLSHSGVELYQEQRLRLAYGRRLGERFLLGASADLLRVSANEYGSKNTATFSLSALAQALPTLWIGARVQNPFQQKINDDNLPGILSIGACWQPTQIFLISSEVEKDLEKAVKVKAGFEYRPIELLAVRAGVRSAPVRVGFGAGLRLKSGFAIDLGSEWHPSLGMTPAAMLVWRKP